MSFAGSVGEPTSVPSFSHSVAMAAVFVFGSACGGSWCYLFSAYSNSYTTVQSSGDGPNWSGKGALDTTRCYARRSSGQQQVGRTGAPWDP